MLHGRLLALAKHANELARSGGLSALWIHYFICTVLPSVHHSFLRAAFEDSKKVAVHPLPVAWLVLDLERHHLREQVQRHLADFGRVVLVLSGDKRRCLWFQFRVQNLLQICKVRY